MRLTEHTKIRKEKFGTVVFETLTEKIFVVSEHGGDILELVKEGKKLAEIVDELSNNYDGDREAIEKDVVEFTEALKANKLIIE